ncbi:YmfL family putative regulatory protein [Pseudomonas baltica]|uniref:YmfL family putative regulatory protein n=1 Tax=Pseudomonas baltica TaxID=2762576 RepID=UPI002897B4B4|nr:YmfL family putative regulatory protein [Pseudomonas baltica]
MKRSTLETRRQVVSALIGAYPGGRECAAPRLGLDLKKFDNHAYENKGARPLSDSQIHQLEQDAGTAFLPEYVCGLYGGVFVPLANPEQMDNLDLYARAVNTAVKRGAVDLIIAEALKDGVINALEVEQILAAHRAHVAARHEEIAAVIILHREK